MPVTVYCPTCKGNLNVPDTLAGKPVSCPGCKGTLQAPNLESEPRPAPRRRRELREDEDDRPRARYVSSFQSTILAVMWALCFCYTGFALFTSLGGASLMTLIHIVGPVCVCFCLERLMRSEEWR